MTTVEPSRDESAAPQPRFLPGPVDILCALFAAPLLGIHALLTEDTFWHLALGEQTLRDRAVPTVESFSFTVAGAPLTSHSWLMDVLLAAIERMGGLGLVEVAGFALVALTFRTIVAIGRALGASPAIALLPVFFFAASSSHFLTLRPQLATYLILGWLFLACLANRAGHPRALLASPLVFVLWSNLHGGFLIGIAFLLGFAVLEVLDAKRGTEPDGLARAKRLALLAAIGAGAACIHPNGFHQFTDAFANTPAGDPIHKLINEWQPPDLSVVPFLSHAIIATAALALLARPPLHEGLIVLGSLQLALSAWRNVPVFGLVAGPVVAAWATRALAAAAPGLAKRSPTVAGVASKLSKLDRLLGVGGTPGGVLLIALIAIGAGIREARAPGDVLSADLVQKKFPVEAVRFSATQHFGPRLFNSYEWGGYVTHQRPEQKIFIDSRMVPFKPLLDDYIRLDGAAPGAAALLDAHRIDWALVPAEGRLAALLRLDPRWEIAYAKSKDVAVIFSRSR